LVDEVVGLAAFFVVEGFGATLTMVASVDDAGWALLELVGFLHDLRPSDALETVGTGWGPRGLRWRRRILARWAPWPGDEASVRTARARRRAEVGSWKSMVMRGMGAAGNTKKEG
jgi:hypothetical protein